MTRRILLWGLVLTVAVAGVGAANLWRPDSARTSGAGASLSRGLRLDWDILKPPPREVELDTPRRGRIVQTITAPGEVELVEEAKIASQIVGRVIAVEVKDGQRVKAGDILVRLDELPARARLDSSLARIEALRAAISRAEADRDKAQRDLARISQLADRQVVTPTELADARSAMSKAVAAASQARNELMEAEAMLRASQQDLDYATIRAPIDGAIAALDVEVGEVVIAGTTNLPGTVLMTVGDPSRLRVRADVDETDVPLVRPDQTARIYLLADSTHPVPGVVEQVAPKGEKTGEVVTFETLVRVEAKDTALRAAMTATVEIEVKSADSVLGVPVQAVVHRRRKDLPDSPAIRQWAEQHAVSAPNEKARDAEARYIKIVFVNEGGIARARPVETGISDEQRIEILAGLKESDSVIVGPFRALDELKDGDAVVLQTEEETATSAAAGSTKP
jgi:HlyD family secretion protein